MLPKCDICPLATASGGIRESKLRNLNAAIIIDAPHHNEVTLGASSRYVDLAHNLGGLDNISVIPLVSCPIPGNNLKQYQARRKYKNKLAARSSGVEYNDPVSCCKPRFDYEVSQHNNLLLLGTDVNAAMHPIGFMDALGSPYMLEYDNIVHPTITTFSPEQLQHTPEFRAIMLMNLNRFIRQVKHKLAMTPDPIVVVNPAKDEFAEFMYGLSEYVCYDLETTVADELTNDILLLGIGIVGKVYMIDFKSISAEHLNELLEVIRYVWLDRKVMKVGQNSDYFDTLVFERWIGIEPVNTFDTMQAHKLGYNEYPHNLGFIISQFFDSPAWKAAHTAVNFSSTAELIQYCAYDVDKTARVAPVLIARLRELSALPVYKFDAKLNALGRGMKKLGMRVDIEALSVARDLEQNKLESQMRILTSAAPGVLWTSNQQVCELFYETWQLPIPHETIGGAPSVDDNALLELLQHTEGTDLYTVIKTLRDFRTTSVIRNSFLEKWTTRGMLDDAGYIHPSYSVLAATGRYVSYDPNFQNLPVSLRHIFIPPEGCVYIYADKDQIEMRFVALVAGMTKYLDMFIAKNIDPHNLTMVTMLGSSVWQLEGAPTTPMGKGTGRFEETRTLAKGLFFATIYGARAKKVRELIRTYTDKAGNMPFLNYSIQQVTALHQKLLENLPELKAWWQRNEKMYRANGGYVSEIIMGRKRYSSGYDLNMLVNHEIQGGGFADVGLGMLDLNNDIPFDFERRTGLCNQLHDGVLYSVPEELAEYYRQLVETKMTRTVTHEGRSVLLSAKAEIRNRWNDSTYREQT